MIKSSGIDELSVWTSPGQENINLESLFEPERSREAGDSAQIGIKSYVACDIFNEKSIGAV